MSDPNLVFKLSEIRSLSCVDCQRKLSCDGIEPISSRYDLRTFVCRRCSVQETFIIDVSEKVPAGLPVSLQ